jgi:hypothetical protein
MSDDACIHDHPWSFISFIYKGGYYEWTVLQGEFKDGMIWKQAPSGELLVRKWYRPGSLIYRPAKWAHALELKVDENGKEIPCSTFVMTLRVSRRWGFFTPLGWIYWKDYNKGEHCNG